VTTFLLARHAAHDWLGRGFAGRLPGVMLNEEGQRQARELASRLAGERLAAIYCSPQQRTWQTAEPVAAQQGLDIRIDAAFDEVDLGDWTGRTFAEVRDQEAWQHWLERRSSAQPPGGEPFAQVAQRAMDGLRRLVREYPEQLVLVVSHGDVLKAMIATCLGLSLDLLERFDLAPASVSLLALGEDWSQLRLLNAQGPLR
jgi:probable phosphoglycerate mutase